MKIVVDNNLKPFVNNPDLWNAFYKEIEDRLQLNYAYLASAKEVDAMMRYQGRISVLQELLHLREHVNGIDSN